MRAPIYERIARDLRNRIVSGKVSVGQALPTEAALCSKYGVSRYTAREALRRLREAGLITRRRRSGTTVAASAPAAAFTLAVSSAADLFRYASDTRFFIARRGLVPVSPAEAAVLGVRAGQRWFRLNGVRQVLGSGSPLCLVTVYLHASLAALGRRLPRAARAIYPQVEEALGARIAWVRQRIEAVALDAAQAAQLGAHAGECALRVRRYYHDGNDRLLEVSDSLHPGERFAYEMRLKRDTPGFGASRP